MGGERADFERGGNDNEDEEGSEHPKEDGVFQADGLEQGHDQFAEVGGEERAEQDAEERIAGIAANRRCSPAYCGSPSARPKRWR